MDDKIVLICATGRSGSTTMLRLLNTMPNTNICGENGGAINSLLDFYRNIKRGTFNNIPGKTTPFTYDYILKKNIKPSWYNCYNIHQIRDKIREMIISMFKMNENIKIWGFKEIRYDYGKIDYIREFKELFPQTKVIIQIRGNIQSQSRSGWFREDPNSIEFLKKTNKELVDFYIQNPSYCYFTTFEQMFDRSNLHKIFEFIGCSQHYNEKKITEVLNNNIKD